MLRLPGSSNFNEFFFLIYFALCMDWAITVRVFLLITLLAVDLACAKCSHRYGLFNIIHFLFM